MASATKAKPEITKDEGADKAAASIKRFEAQERKCQRLEREVNECKEELKQAKASYDFAVGELRRMGMQVPRYVESESYERTKQNRMDRRHMEPRNRLHPRQCRV